MTKVTILNYYYIKMDNIQRQELWQCLGIGRSTFYNRVKDNDSMSVREAKIFIGHVFKCFGVKVRIEDLCNDVMEPSETN